MNRFIKKLFCLFLSIVAINFISITNSNILPSLSVFSSNISAATIVDSDSNVTWSLDSDGLLTISGSEYMEYYDAPVDIPWFSNITIIPESANVLNAKVKSVTLPLKGAKTSAKKYTSSRLTAH